MKATLVFTLPEDHEELKCAQNGLKYRSALEEMDSYLRGRLKYEDLDLEVATALEAARRHLNELMRDE